MPIGTLRNSVLGNNVITMNDRNVSTSLLVNGPYTVTTPVPAENGK